MAKTLIITQSNSQIVVHDSDGKNSTPALYAGVPMMVSTAANGKVIATHGQVVGTTVVHNNPA